MNKEKIELLSISKLTQTLLSLDYVIPEIPSNDKSPSWDGYIKLYKKKNSSKKDQLEKRIPIQVKGHYSKPPYNDSITFAVDTADLTNYLNESGVFFFVIFLDENDNYKIYYQSLTRLKLRRYIKGKEHQNSISIYLESFPKDNIEAVDIFFNFTIDMNMTLSPNQDFTIKDFLNKNIPGFETLTMNYKGIKYRNDPLQYFLNHHPTLP